MAITVNGAVLRNMPEQISKNVEDIAELQTTSENYGTRITALENDVVLAATFEDTTMTGTTSIGGTALNISVPAAFTNTITASSIAVTSLTAGSSTISGNETVSGTLGVSGNVTASSDVSVAGDLSVTGSAQIFENIIDSSGNNRFFEVDGTFPSIEGFDVSYCKASLSGTHLMLVVAGTIANGTSIPNGTNFAQYIIPAWVLNKISIVWGVYFIEAKSIKLFADDWTSQDCDFTLSKGSTSINIKNLGVITATANRAFRIQFDLLVDND